ncbi:DnaJ domain-containing protein [Xylaria grammica]|nr:DnaJ domain-containing protein [Xylaria grammica]
MPGHYAVLGISRTATPEEIHTAYRRLAMIHHPDRNPNDTVGATARFQKIQQAYEVLSNSFERRRYDATQSTTFPPEVPHASSSEHRYQRPNNTTFYTAHNHRYHLEGMIASLKHMYDQSSNSRFGKHACGDLNGRLEGSRKRSGRRPPGTERPDGNGPGGGGQVLSPQNRSLRLVCIPHSVPKLAGGIMPNVMLVALSEA